MQVSIKCPDCGKTLKVTVTTEETKKMKMIKQVLKETTWSEIAEQIKSGKVKEFLSVEDKIPFELKNGQKVCAVVAAVDHYNKNEVIFTFEDCIARHSMNENNTNIGGWKDCKMREYLNNDIYDLLPDDLKEIIKERKIIQRIKDKEYISTDKLWLPSCTELGYKYSVDVDDVQFPLFKDEKSRIKQIDGETVWWWERSPIANNSNYFYIVYYNGYSYNYYANYSNGVCPCFSIGA